jgi:large subunit ribosomal protein L33
MATVRVKVRMDSEESDHFFTTTKNPRTTTTKLALRRYDPVVRKHVMFNEKKIK